MAKEVGQEIRGRPESLARAHCTPKPVKGSDRSKASRDEELRRQAKVDGRDALWFKGELEERVVDYCDQRLSVLFQASGTGLLAEGAIEPLRKGEVLEKPAFGGGVGKGEMEPEERVLGMFGSKFEPWRHVLRGNGCRGLANGEQVCPNEAILVGAVGGLGSIHAHLSRERTTKRRDPLHRIAASPPTVTSAITCPINTSPG